MEEQSEKENVRDRGLTHGEGREKIQTLKFFLDNLYIGSLQYAGHGVGWDKRGDRCKV